MNVSAQSLLLRVKLLRARTDETKLRRRLRSGDLEAGHPGKQMPRVEAP